MPKPIKLSEKDIERFWSKVLRRGSDDCWFWIADFDKDGYGIFELRTIEGDWKPFRAHRIACHIQYGDAGQMTCHTCNNPDCVNPNHLYPGNGKRNSEDRDKNGSPIRGEENYNAVLTEKFVKLALKMRTPTVGARTIAKRLGCSAGAIFHIFNGRSWNHITGIPKHHA